MKTLAGTIAYRNPQGAAIFLQKYGVKAINNPQMLEAQIHKVISRERNDQVIEDLMEQHPDKDALVKSVEAINHDHSKRDTKHHNCCGSSNFDGDNFSNCTGCAGKCGMKKDNHFAADGTGSMASPTVHSGINNTMVLGILAITTIFALVVLSTRKAA